VLGKTLVDALPQKDRELLLAITFAGCCGHKDLNTFKYGVARMNSGWEERKQTPPVLLANKANAATIQLGANADSAAVQRAVDSSSRRGLKASSLAGALFNHSDDKKGYQDIHHNFMMIHKQRIHGIKDHSRFPDTSNTRYQSHTYAAAELITFLDLYIGLLEDVRDSKVKSATFNHVEENVHKALQDPPTVAELAAMTLYGMSISWPYLRTVRGDGSKVKNLLESDLIDLHRQLPGFCDSIASDPSLLLQTNIQDYSQITLDGEPWSYPMAAMSIRILISLLEVLMAGDNSLRSLCLVVLLTLSRLNNGHAFLFQQQMMPTKAPLDLGGYGAATTQLALPLVSRTRLVLNEITLSCLSRSIVTMMITSTSCAKFVP